MNIILVPSRFKTVFDPWRRDQTLSPNAGKQPDNRRPWRKPGIFQIILPNSMLDGPANPVPSPIVNFCFPPPWDKLNWRVSVKLTQSLQSGMVNKLPRPPLPTQNCAFAQHNVFLYFSQRTFHSDVFVYSYYSSALHNHFLYSGMITCSDLKRPLSATSCAMHTSASRRSSDTPHKCPDLVSWNTPVYRIWHSMIRQPSKRN
jgi:hypothetical protein